MSNRPETRGTWTQAAVRWLIDRVGARRVGRAIEWLQRTAAHADPRVGEYALDCNNPQTLCFLIDAYPVLQRLLAGYPRLGTVTLLDIGPAFGAAAGLIAQMHRSTFLGPQVQVEALDIDGSRERFIGVSHPRVGFVHRRVEDLPATAQWDLVYCSNAIEHVDDPRAFIAAVLAHTRGHAIFLAPYREAEPRSLDHRGPISEETFEGFAITHLQVFRSAAWPPTAEGVDRQQILVVLAAAGAARHWDAWQARQPAAGAHRMVDWGDHPEVLRAVWGRAFGREGLDLMGFLRERLPAGGRALSLCCGDGGFERQLLAQGVLGCIEGVDVSPARVAAAQAVPMPGLSVSVADIDAAEFGHGRYDVVVAKAALHHIRELESVLDRIAECLGPDGLLVTLDFFGPTRFQWTDRQLEAANRFLSTEVPEAMRRRADGSLYVARRPTVAEMVALDPSEAVRSGELLDLLRARFECVVDLPLGGTLLALILHGEILHHFDPDDPEHNALVRRACALEAQMLDAGQIESDFRLILARPRRQGAVGRLA